jgi:hypothetical protein
MAGTTIGEVNINLRMSLAQFKQDVKNGTEDASRNTRKMAQDMSQQTQEAKGTLMLLGEEIGVHMPRHLTTLIAKIPGVGTALQAAFTSVAVLAMIEVIAKVIEKIGEMRQKAEDAAKALKESGEVGPDSILKINESILSLDAQLAELSGNYLQALLDKLDLIDKQNLDDLVNEFEKVQKAADDALDKFQVGFFENLFSFGKDKGLIAGIKADLDGTVQHVKELRQAGASAADVGDLLAAAMSRVNTQLKGSKDLHQSVIDALNFEKSRIEDMQREYEKLNEKTAKQKEVEHGQFDKAEVQRVQEEGRAREELTNKVRTLTEATLALLAGERSQAELAIQKIEEQIAKLRELDAEREREHPGIKTFYGDQIKALQQKLVLMRQEQAEQEALYQRGIIPGLQSKTPNFGAPDVTPIYGGSSAQLTLQKIQTDSKTAQAELTKVVDATQDINTKFEEQSAILDQLHKQYPQVFNEDMLKKAKDAINPVALAWKQFGQDIGDTIKQAALFGRSWSDALKSIVIELLQVILKLTLMKSLTAAGGGGGFFGSILNGLIGGARATGGPVTAGSSYLVGEEGPEWFTPGSSGHITPNGGGGGTVNNYYDARGADVAAIQRLEQLIDKSKYDAVSMSVAAVNDQRRRR